MKKDLTNRRVVNSIGIGILAVITSGTPVLAAINNAMSENDTVDPAVGADMQTETADAAAIQNAEIIDVLTDTQNVIQNVQDELNQQGGDFGDNTGDNSQGAGDMATPPAGEGTEGGEVVDPQPPTEAEVPSDGTQPTEPGESQPPVEPEAQPGENTPQTTPEDVPPTDLQPETSPAAPVDTPTTPENVESVQPDEGSGTEQEKTYAPNPAINEHLENAKDAIGNIKEDIKDLDKENKKAEDAVAEYNEAVANPNNYIGSIADRVSDASSAIVDAVDSVTKDENTAREQAQIAIDIPKVGYESREEAIAAQQKAQEAAAAAEEAYKSAQAAVEEAEHNKKIADENLSELKRQKDAAETALEEMNARVQDAQEKLRDILESNGFSMSDLDSGSFLPGQLKGDAAIAYQNAQDALTKAREDLGIAQSNYAVAAEGVGAAEESFKNAEQALETLIGDLTNAENAANDRIQELNQENYNALYTEYSEKHESKELTKLDVIKAQAALQEAEEALKEAQKVKDKTHDVVENAQAAVLTANNKEDDAKKAAEEAKKAVQDNAENINNALERAKSAEEKVKKAAEEANRAVECLKSVKEAAEDAEKKLEEAEKNRDSAEIDCKEKEDACNAAESALEEVRNTLLKEETKNVLKAQKAAEVGGETEELALAVALIRYVTSKADVIKNIEIIEDSQRKWDIKVTYLDGDIETYWYSKKEEGLVICKGTEYFFSESEFERNMEREEETQPQLLEKRQALNKAQEAFANAKSTLKDAEKEVDAAEQERDKAAEQMATIKALENVAKALEMVSANAGALVQAEEKYQKDYEEKADNIIVKLDNLLSKGTDLRKANDKLEEVNKAKNAIDNAILSLTELTAQDNADQSAYKNLVNAYNTAKADYDEALEALEKCVAGRERAETEKNRARTAADAIFRYVSGEDNVQPTQPQPQPVNPIQPVYGTLIDTVTTPIIANRGVPTGTGYTGYTYTIGGQPAYTVGETTAPGEETADELVNVEDSAVPLAAVGENNKNKTTNTKNTRAVSDEKIPLDDMKTENNKASWWWILVIALLGATGTEMYIRHKEKTEQERKSKTGKQSYAKI